MQTQYYCYGCSINKTDFPVVKVHVDEVSSARNWQHKLCAILPATANINHRLSHQSILPYLYYYTNQNRNNSWKPYCVMSFSIGWKDIYDVKAYVFDDVRPIKREFNFLFCLYFISDHHDLNIYFRILRLGFFVVGKELRIWFPVEIISLHDILDIFVQDWRGWFIAYLTILINITTSYQKGTKIKIINVISNIPSLTSEREKIYFPTLIFMEMLP